MPNCVHGFPQNDCLICRTLGAGPGPAAAKAAAPAAKPGRKTKRASSGDLDTLLMETPGAPLPVARNSQARSSRSSGKLFLWKVVGVVVAAGLLWLLFGGVLNLAFHIVEYAFVGLAAGWVGYELGRLRGRRGR